MSFRASRFSAHDPRGIFITTKPGARNLNESRRILAALQQKFGEVVEFRNQRYDVTVREYWRNLRFINRIYVSFASPEAAQSALRSENITVGLDDLHSHAPSPSPSPSSSFSDPHPHEPLRASALADDEPEVFIQCSIEPRTQGNTSHTVKRNPFNRHFRPDKKHPIFQDLRTKLGAEGGLGGLADAPPMAKDLEPLRKMNRNLKDEVYRSSLMKLWRMGQYEFARAAANGDEQGSAEDDFMESESGHDDLARVQG
ncbi:hypothetical protein BDV06DRAFT_163560 [Aspergillus oleicola]